MRDWHEDFPSLDSLGQFFPAYSPLFTSTRPFVDSAHAGIARLPQRGGLIETVPKGFLRPADALAIYELAWHASADILELGSAWGLSTTILCRATHHANRGSRVVSIEIAPDFHLETQSAVAALGFSTQLDARLGDAATIMPKLARKRRRFSLAFIDHDHSEAASAQACALLDPLLLPGGIAVFHDLNDRRHVTQPGEYGIYPAVAAMIREPQWKWLGILGCCGFVHKVAP